MPDVAVVIHFDCLAVLAMGCFSAEVDRINLLEVEALPAKDRVVCPVSARERRDSHTGPIKC